MGIATVSREVRLVNVGDDTSEANHDAPYAPPRKPLHRLHPAQARRQSRLQPSKYLDRRLTHHPQPRLDSDQPADFAFQIQNRSRVVGTSTKSPSSKPTSPSLSQMPTNNSTQMIYYAIPCASVLILELLRQTDQPQPHQPMAVSRSTLIQDLSVLISCCDWLTEPDQQNYKLCKRAQSIFSRSLDRILNPVVVAAPTTAVPVGNGPSQQHHRQLSDEDAHVAVPNGFVARQADAQQQQPMLLDEPEWMAWLDTCDLQADPWLDILAESSAQQGYANGL